MKGEILMKNFVRRIANGHFRSVIFHFGREKIMMCEFEGFTIR